MTYNETRHLPIPTLVSWVLAMLIIAVQPNLYVSAIAFLMAVTTFWGMSHAVRLVRAVEAVEAREGQLVHQAAHDPLTGALNRQGFTELIDQLDRIGVGSFGVVYVDLDGFKQVNDQLGHAAGDQILRETADRLQSVVREADHVARLGGDEFALVLPNLSPGLAEEVTAGVCRRVVDLCQGFKVGDLPVMVTASVGAAVYPDHGANLEELLAHADEAMYLTKKAGKNSFTVYGADPRAKSHKTEPV